MKLLLDTHVLLWWLDAPKRLSPEARSAIRDEANAVVVSAAAVWEVIIKKSIGKLEAPDDLADAIAANGFESLAISAQHALQLQSLPGHHRDPFDRILIAQAMQEGMTLVHRDAQIRKYSVSQILA